VKVARPNSAKLARFLIYCGRGFAVFNAAEMSAAEFEFVRVYVRILQQRFGALQTVMACMHSENLALADVVQATYVTEELDRLRDRFERQLQQIRIKWNWPTKADRFAGPSMDQLADIVMVSFFKVVGAISHGAAVPVKEDQGWFSGKPKEWPLLFDSIKEEHTPPSPSELFMSQYMQSIAKLFPQYYHKNKWSKLYPPPPSLDYDDDDDEEDEWVED
jgi:hypothetical protein